MGLELNAWRRGSGRTLALGLGGALLLGLTGCSTGEGRGTWSRMGMVEPASDRAPFMSDLWIGAWIACAVISVMVWGLIFYAMYKFRRREGNQVPRQTRYHVPLEVLYTVVPFLIIIVLFFYTVRAENRVLAKTEPAHTVNVVGQKWSWSFNYMEQDNAKIGAVAHEVGTIEKIPDLYVPVNKPIRFNLESADVIHSFWVPAWYFKLDVIPGHKNSFDVTPTKLGTFDGKCAELCGTYHAAMLFTVHVVTEEEYNAYVKGLVAKGQTGERKPPSAASALPSAPAKEEKK
ncbi:cytochrome c oxidase subunit 2 [Luteococcus japonicus]|uniref:Cytochrome c oxidase subunit 2 n=2 Tax=Luteococcus japonicus TaxID=33984 RepID=A0A3N1ZXL1_9ACTN|nr:cytochrome c oxidase subunit 2 [Luteococcus japonicus]